MKNKFINRTNFSNFVFVSGLFFTLIFPVDVFAQKQKSKTATKTSVKKTAIVKTNKRAAQNLNLPKVTQIDALALKNLLKREAENAKPLLVNFWATWCDPCREEFPDLVKIDSEYKGKIDFITVSIDDLAEINRDVPKFLLEMKAEMPAYLLKTLDEEAAIASVAKDWKGGMPFTVLFNEKGELVYSRQGKVELEIIRAEIEKTIEKQAKNATDSDIRQELSTRREIEESEIPYQKGKDDAQKDILSEKLQIIRYGEGTSENSKLKQHLKVKYGVEMLELGCKVSTKLLEYVKGYNEVLETEIKRRYGINALERIT
ncbi:MAG: TlpA family protein disulfide reductase [Acidobacteriota bacterium]|nr:TlpA family protein disulfide reductase [Acidobacteriota bacterium]